MEKMTVEQLMAGLVEHDDGVLSYGAHKEGDRKFCALEYRSIMKGRKFSDAPVDMPDIRPLQDAFGVGAKADALRTKHIIPVMAALWDWDAWSGARQKAWSEAIVIALVKTTIADLTGLPDAVQEKCRSVTTLAEAAGAAAEAAGAAAGAAAWDAAEAAAGAAAEAAAGAAAGAAAEAATRDAAWAAGAAAEAAILIQTCQQWIDAAVATEGL